ncbi:alpha/beta-hydrolase [Violaceomyces palustris]|uniref:Alpha/beta-hydrolase n=1 Tax=Violaceomyces palustris TaxID=1673888 RepID=A0ACD0NTA4_9BASI|nr:alpha/beta-hydrolase [Violaceomyces palustris]
MQTSRFLANAHVLPLSFCAIYFGFLAAMLAPWSQKQFVFLHNIPFPFFPKFLTPQRYGLAPFKVRNFRLTTSDGVSLGAWHILPDEFYQEQMAKKSDDDSDQDAFSEDIFDQALQKYPTIIYLHGNAANRAAPFRVSTYSLLTNRLPVNVVAIDYRGFGDSQGDPCERGLVLDARAAWDWVIQRRGTKDEPTADDQERGVVIMGQSLGTGVAAKLGQELTLEGTPPQAVVLFAAYSGMRRLLTSFRPFGLLPLFAPFQLPILSGLADRLLVTKFETSKHLPEMLFTKLGTPGGRRPHLVLLHAEDDRVIPSQNSKDLFHQLWTLSRSDRPSNFTIPTFATVETFQLGPHRNLESPNITLINTLNGGHDRIGEGQVDLIARFSGLK